MGDISSLGDFQTNGTQDSRFSTNVPGNLVTLKHSAREKAALVMSLVQLLTTPVACIVLCLVGKVADLEMFGVGIRQITVSHPVFYYFLVQLFATFLGYHAAWLACSMYAQRLAFALPLTLATPLALVFIEVNQLCNAWLIPLPRGPDLPMYYLIGITALLLLGQFLSTGYYVWANKGYIMGKASHLFWLPSYTGKSMIPTSTQFHFLVFDTNMIPSLRYHVFGILLRKPHLLSSYICVMSIFCDKNSRRSS